MTKNYFWRNWRRVSQIERRAIQGIKNAQNTLFQYISKSKLVALYIKGSFVRREMLATSDVDMVPIVNDNKYINKILDLDKEKKHLYRPAELLPLSLWELQHRKRYPARHEQGPKGNPSIDEFSTYKLIWGKELDTTKYPVRTPIGRFKGLLGAFNTTFLPLYAQKQFAFCSLIKQVFWLTRFEQHLQGKIPPDTWKKLARATPKKHIVHDAWELRNSKKITQQQKDRFLTKLKVHLKKMKKLTDC